MKGTTNTSASQRTLVRGIDGSYLMIYAYKTQEIASCKTLKSHSLQKPNSGLFESGHFAGFTVLDLQFNLLITIRVKKQENVPSKNIKLSKF